MSRVPLARHGTGNITVNLAEFNDVLQAQARGRLMGLWQDWRGLNMAEEVGVEPTRHFVSASLVLKTRHPTGDVALP